jgi:hypothetical protein
MATEDLEIHERDKAAASALKAEARRPSPQPGSMLSFVLGLVSLHCWILLTGVMMFFTAGKCIV